MSLNRCIHSPSERFPGPNARFDLVTADVVERGIRFLDTLGKTVAIAYFKEKNLPDALMHRLLTGSQPRRGRVNGADQSGLH